MRRFAGLSQNQAAGGRRPAISHRRATESGSVNNPRRHIVVIGGGPGGYEAALVAAQLGADVTVIEESGLGGSCVLTDCVPSKTLIATASLMAAMQGGPELGIRFAQAGGDSLHASADPPGVYRRIKGLARAQSADVGMRLGAEGVQVIEGRGRLVRPGVVAVGDQEITAGTVLIATGAEPRELPGAVPDGERLLTCRQLYDLNELPDELIVVGSGVTGAEFASAYQALGSQVTLVSSRHHVLPNEDTDAAMVVEDV